MNLQSLQISWDAYPKHGKTVTDLEEQKIQKFIEKVNASKRFTLSGDWKADFQKLRLIDGDKITQAAWLLFGNESVEYNVHLGRFKTPSLIIDDKMLHNTLFEVVEETMKYLIGQIKVAFEIKGMPTQRTEIFEYPIPALRELVLNAVIHRDYLSPIDIQIKVFDKQITFYNPGELYGDLTIEQLKRDDYQANTRNKLIAEAFYLTGDIEKYGSGLIRIRKEVKEYPTMKLSFEKAPNGFLAWLQYEKQRIGENISEGVSEGVSVGVNELFNLIKKDSGNRTPHYASNLKVPEKTIERWIKQLREENKIKFKGAPKTGGYYVIEDC